MRALIIAVTAIFFVTACGKKSSNKGGGIRQVKGDPFVFVKGSAMNGTNSVPQAFFSDGASWSLDMRGFAEEPPEQPKGNIEDGEEAPDPSSNEAEQRRLSEEGQFQATAGGFTFKNSFLRARFMKNDVTGTIQLHSIESAKPGKESSPYVVGKDIRVLHTSFNDQAFSILIQSDVPGDRFVIDMFFSHSGPIPLTKDTSDNYYYLLGKGLKFQWPQDHAQTLVLCGDPGRGAAEAFERGANAWRPYLAGRLQFQTYAQTSCPPFSDVNSRVTVFVDDWIEIVGPQAKAAFTTSAFYYGKGEIADSDIFFLRGEWQEMIGGFANLKKNDTHPRIVQAYYETLAHEMGHFLGLHHQFDHGVPSIMGYDDVSYITNYDSAAIQALYPKVTAP
jgi:hypothetical protein